MKIIAYKTFSNDKSINIYNSLDAPMVCLENVISWNENSLADIIYTADKFVDMGLAVRKASVQLTINGIYGATILFTLDALNKLIDHYIVNAYDMVSFIKEIETIVEENRVESEKQESPSLYDIINELKDEVVKLTQRVEELELELCNVKKENEIPTVTIGERVYNVDQIASIDNAIYNALMNKHYSSYHFFRECDLLNEILQEHDLQELLVENLQYIYKNKKQLREEAKTYLNIMSKGE